MSVTGINDKVRSAVADSKVSLREAYDIFNAAKDGGVIDADEKAALVKVVQDHSGKMDFVSRFVFKFLVGRIPDAPRPAAPATPVLTDAQKVEASMKVAAADGKITLVEVERFVAEAQAGGLSGEEKTALTAGLRLYDGKLDPDAKAKLQTVLGIAPQPVAPATVPGEPVRSTFEAARAPWTTTYWPMASSCGDTQGSTSSNLWAKDGALDKFDSVLKARGTTTGARDYELKPALNWLLSDSNVMKGATRTAESGEWIADGSLSEKDAERTTGVDFNNNGKIDPNVEWDFIDAHGNFGTDGKTDGSMSVGWWGSCDKVARAGILFAEPKKDVTIDGVTFTPQDIKGLLTVLSDSQGGGSDFVGNRYDGRPDVITLKNGSRLYGTITSEVDWNGAGTTRPSGDDYRSPGKLPAEVKVKLMDGTEKTFKAEELRGVMREDKRDDASLFHTTIRDWLKSGRPAVMDKDSGPHVWNYNFYKAEDVEYKDGLKPSWAPAELKEGFNGPAGDGKITYVDRTVSLGGGGGQEHYQYWLEEKNGKVVNSGWVSGSSPDFLWRPQTEAAFTGKNARNPFVDPKLVKEIYEKSIAP